MQFNLYTDYSSVPIDRTSWNDLADQNETNTIFQTREWFDCWWQTCGHDYQLVMFTCEDKGELKLIAPFMISTAKNGKRILRFASDSNSDYCDIIAKGSKQPLIQELIKQIFGADLEFDTIVLQNIPSHSTTHDHIFETCKEFDIPVNFGLPSISSKLVIKKHEADVSRILKKYSVKRPFNKLIKQGEVKFRILDTSNVSDLQKNLEDFFDQHISRCQSQDTRSLFIDEKYRRFYIKLVATMGSNGWINFSALELNGSPIAYHFGFIFDQRMVWYKPTFNTNFSKLSPGAALLMQLIEYCKQQQLEEFDFTIGDESYKQRFCNVTTYNKSLFIHKSKADYYLLKVKRWLIQTPRSFAGHIKRLRDT